MDQEAPVAATPAATPRKRATFLDLLRLVAAFQMIQGHTLDALLETRARSGPVFEAWTFARGMTAPAFLFAAGLAYHLTAVRARPDPAARRARMGRSARLVALGYLLHLPVAALFGDPGALAQFFAIDVLQCIGLTLLALDGLHALVPDRRTFGVIAGAAALVLFSAAPSLVTQPVSPELAPLQNWISRDGGSLFPLAPFAGFALAGVALGGVCLPRGTSTPHPATRMLVATLVIGAAAWWLDAPSRPPMSAAYSLFKLACVLGTASVLAYASARIERLPRVLETLCGETLVLYVSHVLVLYAGLVGLKATVGPVLPLPLAIGAALAMIAVSVACALGWARVRGWRAARLAGPGTRG